MEYEYSCLRFQQREETQAPGALLFCAPAGEVTQWAAVKRREDEEGAAQRRLSPAKWRAVKRFLEQDERNTIPTTIVVTLKLPEEQMTQADSVVRVKLAVPDDARDEDKPGLVIDGQHRLFGISSFRPEAKIGIVALLNVDDAETAFQFLVINNKASRVPTDHIRLLALDYS